MSNTSIESRAPRDQIEELAESSEPKAPFVEPKLSFVEPKLTKRGDFVGLTEGFFGPFTPPSS